jgi:rod shape-determining protein MreB
MFSKRIAIDLGTANVLVYIPKRGIVINEPSVVAIDDANTIVAIGAEAKEMLGRTPDTITASRPLRDGVIADYRITQAMIRHYINKVSGGWRLSRPEVMVCVPAGATSTERRAVIDATLAAGARAAYIIREPVAAAIGAGIPIASAAGNMVVDIGGGTTEIAILSLGGVVAQHSIRVGGNRLDNAIAEYIRRTYGLAIGDRTAEHIKVTLGSALMLTRDKSMEIRGRDVLAGLPKTITIRANEITGALNDELEKILQAIRVVLEQTPPELSSDIIDRGMVLTGGGALLQNLDKMLTQITGVPCVVAEEPLLCVARGTGIALDNLEEYNEASSRSNNQLHQCQTTPHIMTSPIKAALTAPRPPPSCPYGCSATPSCPMRANYACRTRLRSSRGLPTSSPASSLPTVPKPTPDVASPPTKSASPNK